MKPLLIVDAANVMGSKPDGWWRNRRAAAERLRDRVSTIDDKEVILVVEGKARGVDPLPNVAVHNAPGSGDDAIVELVQANRDRPVTVVTADRGLRERVTALGASVIGPRSIYG